MLSAGGQCGRCGISLNHRCDPEEQWKHDPWNDAHSSNEAELTFLLPLNAGCLSTNLRLSVKSTSGGRIFDGVGILHNFLEIFPFSRITRERGGVYKKMGGKAMPKLPCSEVLLALAIALTVIPPAAAERRATAAETLPKDIVILLDNSSSMKINDPYFLVKAVAGQFARTLRRILG